MPSTLCWMTLFTLLVFSLATNPVGGQGPVRTDHATLELVAEKTSIQPGTTFWVAVRIDMEEHWHVYWINVGDSGLPPTIDWQLPEGIQAGEIVWPYPKIYREGPIASYGMSGDLYLLVPMEASPDLAPGQNVTLRAHVDFLICKEICLPGDATVVLSLPVQATPPVAHPRWSEAFARQRLDWPVETGWVASWQDLGEQFQLTVELPAAFTVDEGDNRHFFPLIESLIDHAAVQDFSLEGTTLTVTMKRSPFWTGSLPETIPGVLVNSRGFGDAGDFKAVWLHASLGAPPAGSAVAGHILPGVDSVWLALVLAFIGGLILNLMPCVFPVLSVKIFSFVQHSRSNPKAVLRHGLVFTAGVVFSFWILAGVLIALRASGQELGWGFQLQSPAFVMAVGVVLFLFSLNLLGVFEVGTSLISLAGKAPQEGYKGSFFTGVLATVVATPCTAPFMGVALAFALTQPAAVSLFVFTFLALGMATPYLILSAWPKLLQMLPRPGVWMESFKQGMAFPLLATLVWLTWVLGFLVGNDGLLRFLLGLLFLGMAAWIYGRWTHPARKPAVRRTGGGTALAASLLGLFLAYSGTGQAAPNPMDGNTSVSHGITWEVFSPELVREYRNQGRPVFIDFTAAWCLTCKANEAVVFSSERVRDRFAELDVAMVKADWTRRDPVITQALASYGRTGVPLYVLYPGGMEDRPVILPEILNPGLVLNALEKL